MLLPLPDGPMIETAEPGGKENETSETIRSGPAGVEYSFETFSTFSNRRILLIFVHFALFTLGPQAARLRTSAKRE